MNDIDTFENDLERMLNQSVEARLGPRCQPPAFVPTSRHRERNFRPWLVPLAAAACAVAVTVGTFGATRVLSEHRPVSPASPDRSLMAPAPSVTATTSPGPALSPSSGTTSLGGATLRLPAGWVAKEVLDPYLPGGDVRGYTREWCLSPVRTAVASRSCPLQFGIGRDPAGPAGFPLPDYPAGISSAPGLGMYCTEGPHPGVVDQQVSRATTSFGKRKAVYREWHDRCSDGHVVWVEQYLVNTAPGFIMFSDQTTPQLHSAMALIARYAALPAQTAPLWLSDQGFVRSVKPDANGYLVTIAPTTRTWQPTGEPNRSYLITRNWLRFAVGKVTLRTDGTKVLSIEMQP